MDESFWQQVNRARGMTPHEKISESLQLYDRTRNVMLAGIRHQYPEATNDEVESRYLEYLDIARRLEPRPRL